MSDESVRAALTSPLIKHGCQVLAVSDDAAANRMLMQEHVDVMIIDRELPGSSIDVRRLSDIDTIPYIIALLSGHEADKVAAAYRAGAKEHFIKPFDPEQVACRISVLARLHK